MRQIALLQHRETQSLSSITFLFVCYHRLGNFLKKIGRVLYEISGKADFALLILKNQNLTFQNKHFPVLSEWLALV